MEHFSTKSMLNVDQYFSFHRISIQLTKKPWYPRLETPLKRVQLTENW